MRKFKDKNRQKRKYTRKSDLHSHDSLTRTAWFGFVPLSLIAVGLIATLLISNPAITKSVSNIRVPHEMTEPVVKPIQLSYERIARLVTSTKVTIPKIDPKPMVTGTSQIFSQIINSLETVLVTFGKNSIDVLLRAGHGIVSLTTLLVTNISRLVVTLITDAIKLSIAIGQGVLYVLQSIVTGTTKVITLAANGIVTIVLSASRMIVAISQALFQGLIFLLQGLGNFTLSLLRGLSDLFIALFKGIVFVVDAIWSTSIWVSITIGKAISYIAQSITNAVSTMWNALVNLVKTPFILLGKAYKKVEPVLLFVGRGVSDATNGLVENIAMITNLLSNLSRK